MLNKFVSISFPVHELYFGAGCSCRNACPKASLQIVISEVEGLVVDTRDFFPQNSTALSDISGTLNSGNCVRAAEFWKNLYHNLSKKHSNLIITSRYLNLFPFSTGIRRVFQELKDVRASM